MTTAVNPAPPVRFGWGSLATVLGALGASGGALGSAITSNLTSTGTLSFTGIAAVIVIAFHGFRSWQANGHLKNVPFYQQLVDLEKQHAALIAKVEADAKQYEAPLAAAVAKVDPALAPEIAAVQDVVTQLETPAADAPLPLVDPVVTAAEVAVPPPPAAPAPAASLAPDPPPTA